MWQVIFEWKMSADLDKGLRAHLKGHWKGLLHLGHLYTTSASQRFLACCSLPEDGKAWGFVAPNWSNDRYRSVSGRSGIKKYSVVLDFDVSFQNVEPGLNMQHLLQWNPRDWHFLCMCLGLVLISWWQLFCCSYLFRISFGVSKVLGHLENFTVYAGYMNVFLWMVSEVFQLVQHVSLLLWVGIFVRLKLRYVLAVFLRLPSVRVMILRFFPPLFGSYNFKDTEMEMFVEFQIFTAVRRL